MASASQHGPPRPSIFRANSTRNVNILEGGSINPCASSSTQGPAITSQWINKLEEDSHLGAAQRMAERTWSVLGLLDLEEFVGVTSESSSWIALLNFFDFREPHMVNYEDWVRGLEILEIKPDDEHIDVDKLWKNVCSLYEEKHLPGVVDLRRIKYKVAHDPVVTALLRSIVHTSARMKTLLDNSLSDLHEWADQQEVRSRRLVSHFKHSVAEKIRVNDRKITEPIFRAWLQLVHHARKLRRSSKRVALRILKSTNARYFDAWYSFAAKRLELQKLGLRMLHRPLFRAWDHWITVVDSRQHNLEIVALCIQKGLHIELSRALQTWLALSAQIKRARVVGAKFIFSSAARCLRSWMFFAQERSRCKSIMFRALNRNVYTKFLQWCEACENVKKMKYVLKRAQNTRLVFALFAWHQRTVDLEEMRQRMKRFFVFAINNLCARGFRSWLDFSHSLRNQKLCLRRALNAALVGALLTWARNAFEVRERLHLIRGMMSRWMNSALCASLNSWISWVEGMNRLRRAGAQLANLPLANSFRTWRASIAEYVRSGQLLKRYIPQPLLKPWLTWLQFWSERALQLRKMRRFCASLFLQSQSRAWLTWCEFIDERRKKTVCIRRLFNSKLTFAFFSWIEYLEEMEQQLAVGRRVLARWHSQACAMAWDRWLDLLDVRSRMRSLASALISPELRKAWMSWIEHYELQMKLRQLTAPFLQKPILQAFMQWIDATIELKVRMQSIQRSLAFMKNSLLARTYSTWIEYCSQIVESREQVLELVIRRLRASAVARHFLFWSTFARGGTSMLREAASLWLSSAVQQVFKMWLSLAMKHRRAVSFGTRLMNRGVRNAFTMWRSSPSFGNGNKITARNKVTATESTHIVAGEAHHENARSPGTTPVAEFASAVEASRVIAPIADSWAALLEQARKGVKKPDKNILNEVWREWVVWVHGRKHDRTIFAKKMLQSSELGAFAQWQEYSRKRHILWDAALHFSICAQIATFSQWLRFAKQAKRAALALDQRRKAQSNAAAVEEALLKIQKLTEQTENERNTLKSERQELHRSRADFNSMIASMKAAEEKRTEESKRSEEKNRLLIDQMQARIELLEKQRTGSHHPLSESDAQGIQAQVDKLSRSVMGMETLLVSMPLNVIDAAAKQLASDKLKMLEQELSSQRKEMDNLRRTSASRLDLERNRVDIVHHLFSPQMVSNEGDDKQLPGLPHANLLTPRQPQRPREYSADKYSPRVVRNVLSQTLQS